MTIDSKTKIAIKPGIYRHFKGNEYLVLDIATHSETQETLVIYQPQYGARELWARPLTMFLDQVEVDGLQVPRFEWIRALN